MNNQINNDPAPQTKPLDEFQKKFLSLPKPVQDWMCSFESAENTGKIAQKFNLPEETNPIIANLTGDVILEDIAIDALPALLQENLDIDANLSRQIALEIALKQLLILRDHLKGVENFILKINGRLPVSIPTLKQERNDSVLLPSIPDSTKITMPFRSAVNKNKEILNQLLTSDPIKIPDFDQPVRPTIKNWLSDYIKQKGAWSHNEMERSDYLYKNPNAQDLPIDERAKLAKILKAYDEDSPMPVSPETNLILIEELLKKEGTTQAVAIPVPSNIPPPVVSPMKTAAPPEPTPTPPPVPPTFPRSDAYRELVAAEDLSEPAKPPAKPTPRINGNIVDLSR